ncbi:hypothetical protein Q9966_011415 [Columba livia]|nr:hypothetical protein Q9966_011415 [Columba livia]
MKGPALWNRSPRNPEQKIIKRVIALEGDIIKLMGQLEAQNLKYYVLQRKLKLGVTELHHLEAPIVRCFCVALCADFLVSLYACILICIQCNFYTLIANVLGHNDRKAVIVMPDLLVEILDATV